MEVPFIDLKRQYQSLKNQIDAAVHSVLESGQFIGGKSVGDFEVAFATSLGIPHCIGVANGTDALLVALKGLGVSRGDEVITQAFGWISASEMITLAGGIPIFSDVRADSCALNPALIEEKITPRTKGVVLMHLYGQAGHAQAVKQICDRHRIFLLEDCAQAHLTESSGVKVGTVGHAAAFSFYPTKNLGAYGDAGCVVTHDARLAAEMRLYANHGGLGEHRMEGINSRLDPLQAIVLSQKLPHLPSWTARRKDLAKDYQQRLAQVPEILLPAAHDGHTFHQYVIRSTRRDELKAFLQDRHIQTMIHYPAALPDLPAYRHGKHVPGDFPVATGMARDVLSLPVYPELEDEQLVYVCDSIKLFYGR
jgi:dTDP-4-amino-4,6-dideoxygalactose transaminase